MAIPKDVAAKQSVKSRADRIKNFLSEAEKLIDEALVSPWFSYQGSVSVVLSWLNKELVCAAGADISSFSDGEQKSILRILKKRYRDANYAVEYDEKWRALKLS